MSTTDTKNESRYVGVLNILLPGIRLDEQNPPKDDGWVYYHMMENGAAVLSFADNREEVYDAAVQVFTISKKISDAKRRHADTTALHSELNQAMITFEEAVHSPGSVFTEEMFAIRGNRRWQRIIVNDTEGDEPEGDLVCARYFGEARTWYYNPFWSVNLDNGGIYPLFAPVGKQAIVVDRQAKVIRWMTYVSETGWAETEMFVKREKAATPPAPQLETKGIGGGKTADTPPPSTSTADGQEEDEDVIILCPECKAEMTITPEDYVEAATVQCPACKSTVGPLISEATDLMAEAVKVKLAITDEQVVKLAEAEIGTVGDLAHQGDQEIKKLLGLRNIIQARSLIKKAAEYMPAAAESSSEEDEDEV